MNRNVEAEDTQGMVCFEVDGRVIEIPVDEDGHVPMWALAARFQEYGYENDLDTDSDIVLPADCTPQEVLAWWLDPSSCDIEGLDTTDSTVYDVSGLPQDQRAAQRRIAVVDASPEEQAHIRRVLSNAFTKEELTEMSRNGSFVIKTVPYMGDATGCYYRRQDGIEIPLITLERGSSEDNIVHETVHHIRAVDRQRQDELKTSYPSTEDGRLRDRIFNRLPRSRQDRIQVEEERMTVAETIVRTGLDPSQSGYYDGIDGKDPREAYLEDVYTLTGTPPTVPPEEIPRLKGKAARNAVLKNYQYSNIARARILSKDVKKRRRPGYGHVRELAQQTPSVGKLGNRM